MLIVNSGKSEPNYISMGNILPHNTLHVSPNNQGIPFLDQEHLETVAWEATINYLIELFSVRF